MDSLITALKGVSVQAVLAIMLTGTSCAIWLQGRVVPQDLILLNGIVAAFYFGNKVAENTFKKLNPDPSAPAIPPGA